MFNVQYLKHSNSVQIYLFIAITLFIFAYLFYNENENHTKKCLKNFCQVFFFFGFISIKKKVGPNQKKKLWDLYGPNNSILSKKRRIDET